MLASKSEYLQEASNTVYKMTSDKEIRERCQAREDYLFWERIKNNQHAKAIAERDAALLEKDSIIQNQGEELRNKDSVIQNQEKELARLRAELEALKSGSR